MDALNLTLLGIIALASLVQGVFLCILALSGMKLLRRVEDVQRRIESELKPTLDNLAEISANAAEITALLHQQVVRVESLVTFAGRKAEETAADLKEAVMRQLAPLANAGVWLRSFRRGLRVYQELGAREPKGEAAARTYRDDEHLFI